MLAAIEEDTTWVLTAKVSFILSMCGLWRNLLGKLAHLFAEAMQGGSRVNPVLDVVGDGLAKIGEEIKYEDPNKDIVLDQDGAYIGDDKTPEHYVCPLSGMVSK